jgi:hypothetical protein
MISRLTKKTNSVSPCRDIPWRNYPGYHHNKSSNPCLGHEFLAHLHPNAQKQLYSQINSIAGQKIISTHSPYIAAVAELGQIRNFYKDQRVYCGRVAIDALDDEAQRKIERHCLPVNR